MCLVLDFISELIKETLRQLFQGNASDDEAMDTEYEREKYSWYVEVSLKEIDEAMRLWVYNREKSAKNYLQKADSDDCIFRTSAAGLISAYEALFDGFDKEKLEVALRLMAKCNQLADQRRNKAIKSWFARPKIEDFTEEELHSELIFAESSLVLAILDLLQRKGSARKDLSAAFGFRASCRAYLQCYRVLKSEKMWPCDASRSAFESGTRFGLAFLNLVTPYLPTMIVSVLDVFGFSADRQFGLEQLRKCSSQGDTYRFAMASLLMNYYSIAVSVFNGTGKTDANIMRLNWSLFDRNYPESPYSVWLQSWLEFAEGHQLTGGNLTDSLINLPEPTRPLRESLCLTKFILCAFSLKWREAYGLICALEESATASRVQNRHSSQALLSFLRASSLLMIMREEKKEKELKAEIIFHYRKAESSFGKSGKFWAPYEKFIIVKSGRYCGSDLDSSLFPVLELAYIFNLFDLFATAPQTMDPILRDLSKAIGHVEMQSNTLDAGQYHDKLAGLTFLKGVCLRRSNAISDAIRCYNQVIEWENEVIEETHLSSQAFYELGLLAAEAGEMDRAHVFLKDASRQGGGHLTESLMRHRIQSTLDSFKAKRE